jgi:hypothetical protein
VISSHSELTKTDIRQSPASAGLFFFQFDCSVAASQTACHISSRSFVFAPVVLRGAALLHRLCCAQMQKKQTLRCAALQQSNGGSAPYRTEPGDVVGSYPQKQSQKTSSRELLIHIAASSVLKTGPGNHDCNGFLKFFASAAKIVTMADAARFCARIQNLGAAALDCSIATQPKSRTPTSNHGLSEIVLGVFLTRSRRPRFS